MQHGESGARAECPKESWQIPALKYRGSLCRGLQLDWSRANNTFHSSGTFLKKVGIFPDFSVCLELSPFLVGVGLVGFGCALALFFFNKVSVARYKT